MNANTPEQINNRKVEKIQITITVDKPDPMPFMMHEEVGTGKYGDKDVSVNRNISGNLLLISIGETGYVVDVQEIVKGLAQYDDKSRQ